MEDAAGNVFELLGEETLRQLEDVGVEEPTGIQEEAIPAILRGEDVLVISSTGMGKTEASLLPVMKRVASDGESEAISAIYVTPLRALNRDIWRRMVDFGEALGLRVEVRHGDTSRAQKRRQTENPPDVLITTPETLGIILNVRSLEEPLRNVRHVIVDEYHELMQSKRGVQLSLVLERLKSVAKDRIQLVGLSATIGDPEGALRALLGSTRPGRVLTSDVEREFDCSLIFQAREDDSAEAERYLIDLIESAGKTLVFTNTRGQAESLSMKVRSEASDLKIGVHHGSLSKDVRERIERGFNEDALDAVICTSSMEMGVDITGVKQVVQWTSPRRVTKLAQRIGRSEHRPGAPAKGVVVARTVDDFFESLATVKQLRSGRIEEPITYEGSLDVLAHQMVGMAMRRYGIRAEEMMEVLSGSWFYRSLDETDFERTLSFVEKVGLVGVGGGRCYRRKDAIPYYFKNISTIPEVVSYQMRDVLEKANVATLDEDFVGEHCDKSVKILVNGETWRVVQVEEEERRVKVAKDDFDAAVIPDWVGEMLSVETTVARKAADLQEVWLSSESEGDRLAGEEVIVSKDLEEIKATVEALREAYGLLPGVENVTLSLKRGDEANLLIVHTFQGDRVNETVAQLLSGFLRSRTGVDLSYGSTPYRIIFLDRSKTLGIENLEDAVRRLAGFEDFEEVLEDQILRQGKFLWVLWNVCKKMGVVERGSRYRKKMAEDLYWHLKGKPPVDEAVNEVFTSYFDVEGTASFLEDLASGRESVESRVVEDWTKLEMEYMLGNELPAYKEFMEETEALELLRERVEKSKVNLVCLKCGNHAGPYTLKYMTSSRLECPTCGGKLMGRFLPIEEHWRVVRKLGERKKLTKEDREEFKNIRTTAKLISRFGLPALYCLQSYGIGPETAKRILRKGTEDEEKLFREILTEEKKYFRTRMYWD